MPGLFQAKTTLPVWLHSLFKGCDSLKSRSPRNVPKFKVCFVEEQSVLRIQILQVSGMDNFE